MDGQQTCSLFDPAKLNNFKKPELIEIIIALQKEKNDLATQKKEIATMNERITQLERSQYLYEQYGRRESVEFTGIPNSVQQNDLEDELINIFNEANVSVDGSQLTKKDITACHRIGKRGVTIVRFVNRKFAYQILRNGKNLKDSNLYNNRVYVNNSFCREYSKYGYFIRTLKKEHKIVGYKVRHGVHQIQLEEKGEFHEISHVSDFSKHGLDVQRLL